MSIQKRPGSPLTDRDAKRFPPSPPSPPSPSPLPLIQVIPAEAVPFMRGLSLKRLFEAEQDRSSPTELRINDFGLVERVGDVPSAVDREHAAISNFVFQWKRVLGPGDVVLDMVRLLGNERMASAGVRGVRLDALSIDEDLLPCETNDREEDLSHLMALTGFGGRDLLSLQEEESPRPSSPILPGPAMALEVALVASSESWSRSLADFSSSSSSSDEEREEEGEDEEPAPQYLLHGVEYAGEELDLAVYIGPAEELTEDALWELEMDEEALAPDLTRPEEVEGWMEECVEEMFDAEAAEEDFVF